jgi:hypothetical protein
VPSLQRDHALPGRRHLLRDGIGAPLGEATKKGGCAAICPAIPAIFVAQFYGVPLGTQEDVLIAFVSVIGSAATAGLTGVTVEERLGHHFRYDLLQHRAVALKPTGNRQVLRAQEVGVEEL